MAVLRNKTKRENFLIVSKIFLQDKELSLVERGLLATMHSLPDEWDFSIEGMTKILSDGKSRISSALDGLIKKGYVSREQSKSQDGKFGKNYIVINERPLPEKPSTENPPTVISVAEKPTSDNPPQYNTNEYSIKASTMSNKIHIIDTHIRPYFENKSLSSITPRHSSCALLIPSGIC